MKFGVYKHFKETGDIDMTGIAEATISGELDGVDFSSTIERIRNANSKEEADNLKKTLPAFAQCGTFKGKRANDNLQEYTGIVQGDLDNLSAKALAQVKKLVASDPFTLLGFVSPSGNGYKILIKTDGRQDQHGQACSKVFRYVEKHYGLQPDTSVNDLARLCFFSHEPDCYFNPDAQVFRVQEVLDEPIRGAGQELRYLTKPDGVDQEQFYHILALDLSLQRKNQYVEGNRNNYVHALASWCNSDGIAEPETLAVLQENFDLGPKEIRKCVRNAYKRIHQFGQKTVNPVKTVTSVNRQKFGSGPEIPQEVYEMLPPMLQVFDSINDTRDKDVMIVSLMIVFSNAIPNVHGLYFGRKVYANLYAMIVAGAASGKGMMDRVLELADYLDRVLEEECQREMEEYENWQLLNTDGAVEKAKPKKKRFRLAADSSAAATIQNLYNNNGHGLIAETEIDTMTDTLEQTWASNTYLRTAFHHETIRVARVDKEITIHTPKLALILSGTHDQVKGLLKSRENGLVSRFIFYCYESPAFWKDAFAPINNTIADRFRDLSEEFVKLYKHYLENPFEFKLSENQQKQHFNYFSRMTSVLAEEEGDQSSLRRLGLICFRLAMILTAIRKIDNYQKILVCEDADFQIAMMLCQTFLGHLDALDSIMPSAPTSKRQVFYDFLPQQFRTVDAIEIGKDELELSESTVMRRLKLYRGKGMIHSDGGKHTKL